MANTFSAAGLLSSVNCLKNLKPPAPDAATLSQRSISWTAVQYANITAILASAHLNAVQRVNQESRRKMQIRLFQIILSFWLYKPLKQQRPSMASQFHLFTVQSMWKIFRSPRKPHHRLLSGWGNRLFQLSAKPFFRSNLFRSENQILELQGSLSVFLTF